MARPETAATEWRAHWPLVLAAMAGFSFHSISTYTTGLFIEPLSREFGWSRAQIAGGLTIPALMTVPFAPVIGACIDRWGTRRLAIPGLLLGIVAIAAFGFADGSIAQWMGLWTFYGLVALAVKSTVWTAAVSSVFTAGRGLALGVVLSGTAVTQILAPPLSQWLIAEVGWRQAYFWLSAGWGLPVLLLVIFCMFDAFDRDRRAASRETGAATNRPNLPGLSFRDALRSVALLRIGASSLIMMFIGIAVIVHQVPILTSVGVSRSNAAWLASVGGVAGIAGKLITGWMTDRWNAGAVGAITLATPAIAFALLLAPFRTPTLIVAAMIIISYAVGTTLQICAYLTSRYAGMRSFGKVFGVISSLIAIGVGVGPVIAGTVFDQFGSYAPFLLAGIPGSVICGLLILNLGPYPQWTSDPPVVALTPGQEDVVVARPSRTPI
ncbi:MFS transporter [Phenylobacterium sp. LjRoot219]|uniref:MFS transporter n=1 Tax=Phenylobacterium sp. LjRoot219 TaxID=3342283 RepID=UPI003ECE3E2B